MFRSFMLGLGLMLLAVGCTPATDSSSSEDMTPPPEVAVSIADYQNIMDYVAAQKGKVVVVDCWSTSCIPCVREFPGLVGLHHRFGPEQVACVSVNFDYYSGGPEPDELTLPVLKFLKKHHAKFKNFLSSEDSETLSKKFDIPSIPIVFVYDRDGKQAARFGPEEFTYKDVTAKVNEMLGGPPDALKDNTSESTPAESTPDQD